MRVAFLPDSFHEVNGVAHTARNFTAYAQRHDLPFLCVRAGSRTGPILQEGSVSSLELPRSWASMTLEKDLAFDPLFARHGSEIERALRDFRPDVIHITGPSELGIAGAYFAWRMGIPLAASWHTNVHEYAARRMAWLDRMVNGTGRRVEDGALAATTRFYRLARLLFAPNQELCDLLQARTGKPCLLMQRGVDTELFDPARRTRGHDGKWVLGYVGRLSVEKNVALLPEVQRALHAGGFTQMRFQIIGQGSEEADLRRDLPGAAFPGVLRGEALAEAYANLDLFVFPSETDTFGNVVLEALSSGVPAVVTRGGGPKFIVRNGETGTVTDPAYFGPAIADLLQAPERLHAMRAAARQSALTCSWDTVFERVYDGYRAVLHPTA